MLMHIACHSIVHQYPQTDGREKINILREIKNAFLIIEQDKDRAG